MISLSSVQRHRLSNTFWWRESGSKITSLVEMRIESQEILASTGVVQARGLKKRRCIMTRAPGDCNQIGIRLTFLESQTQENLFDEVLIARHLEAVAQLDTHSPESARCRQLAIWESPVDNAPLSLLTLLPSICAACALIVGLLFDAPTLPTVLVRRGHGILRLAAYISVLDSQRSVWASRENAHSYFAFPLVKRSALSTLHSGLSAMHLVEGGARES
ncbi:hypothetical protein Hypma_014258 [Hypsizygus marmoreus]|uniref:Uncharacterized protein n=1 Tax=Hypsizygus marmoreus TaxID=39966 RepID=A0A369JI74_HYPMA|nr:hypothetical protein Hypma_014258 [Hypsizygus marmoreus]